jgi:hypothetical protein
MVQTLTINSDGTAEINTGKRVLISSDAILSDDIQAKLEAIEAVIGAAGISQLHAERNTFNEFEHAISGGSVTSNPFGTIVSAFDFDSLMQQVDAEAEAAAAAAALDVTGA